MKHGSHVSYCDDLEENQIFYFRGIGPFFLIVINNFELNSIKKIININLV